MRAMAAAYRRKRQVGRLGERLEASAKRFGGMK
jgi:hypothetical protein